MLQRRLMDNAALETESWHIDAWAMPLWRQKVGTPGLGQCIFGDRKLEHRFPARFPCKASLDAENGDIDLRAMRASSGPESWNIDSWSMPLWRQKLGTSMRGQCPCGDRYLEPRCLWAAPLCRQNWNTDFWAMPLWEQKVGTSSLGESWAAFGKRRLEQRCLGHAPVETEARNVDFGPMLLWRRKSWRNAEFAARASLGCAVYWAVYCTVYCAVYCTVYGRRASLYCGVALSQNGNGLAWR